MVISNILKSRIISPFPLPSACPIYFSVDFSSHVRYFFRFSFEFIYTCMIAYFLLFLLTFQRVDTTMLKFETERNTTLESWRPEVDSLVAETSLHWLPPPMSYGSSSTQMKPWMKRASTWPTLHLVCWPISFPEPAKFLLRMLEENEGNGHVTYPPLHGSPHPLWPARSAVVLRCACGVLSSPCSISFPEPANFLRRMLVEEGNGHVTYPPLHLIPDTLWTPEMKRTGKISRTAKFKVCSIGI